MDHAVTALVAVLDEEIAVYRELLQLADHKRKTIGVAQKLPELEQINEQEACLAQTIAEAERKRIQIMDDLASRLGSHLVAGTLSMLAETIGKPDSAQLLARRETLAEVLSELKDMTAVNRKLLDRELKFVNYSLNLVTGSDQGKQGYSELGSKQKPTSGRNLLDWKA